MARLISASTLSTSAFFVLAGRVRLSQMGSTASFGTVKYFSLTR